jgi:hypothetical protein
MVPMIERKCLGCNKAFKVMEGSKNFYHSFECQAYFNGEPRAFDFYLGVEVAPQIPKHGSIEVDDED